MTESGFAARAVFEVAICWHVVPVAALPGLQAMSPAAIKVTPGPPGVGVGVTVAVAVAVAVAVTVGVSVSMTVGDGPGVPQVVTISVGLPAVPAEACSRLLA